jgi:hypothetical protein
MAIYSCCGAIGPLKRLPMGKKKIQRKPAGKSPSRKAKPKAPAKIKTNTKAKAAGEECYHCKQWIPVEEKKTHDCWTTTEEALTEGLPEDLMDAWLKIRELAPEFGEQRIYASHKSIMFSRKACYFFVRPTPRRLELCFFVGRTIKHPFIKKAQATSRVKVAHIVHIVHADEVESPLTDWLKEAFEYSV